MDNRRGECVSGRLVDVASSGRFTSSGDNYDDEWNIQSTFGTSANRPLLIECKSTHADRATDRKLTEILSGDGQSTIIRIIQMCQKYIGVAVMGAGPSISQRKIALWCG